MSARDVPEGAVAGRLLRELAYYDRSFLVGASRIESIKKSALEIARDLQDKYVAVEKEIYARCWAVDSYVKPPSQLRWAAEQYVDADRTALSRLAQELGMKIDLSGYPQSLWRLRGPLEAYVCGSISLAHQ
jgi:hypothetical protein